MPPQTDHTTHTAIGGTVVFSTLQFAPTTANPDAECRVLVWIRQPGRSGLLVACSVATGNGTRGFEAAQAMRRRLGAGTPCAAYGTSLAKPKPREDHGSSKVDLILRGCTYIRNTATVNTPLQNTTPKAAQAYPTPYISGMFDVSRPLPFLSEEFLPTTPHTPEHHRAAA
jgi:hypothetical protein